MKNFCTCLCLAAFSAAIAAEIITVTPPATDAVLFNPGMGLYHQFPPASLPAGHWSNSVCDIAYMRWDWSLLNPEEDVYNFDEVIGKFYENWYLKRGVRIAFRVMSQSMHSGKRCVTPQFIFDKGVPHVSHLNLQNHEQLDPVFWDERYLTELDKFLEALGRWLGNRKGIEFIDIGNIGEWGEMHLARWTQKQFDETGYSHAKYVLAYRKMLDSYKKHLGSYRIFLNVGGQENHTINDYAATLGFHFRQDGLKDSGASYNCGQWLYIPYAAKGVLCNYEFHSSYKGMKARGWSFPGSIDVVMSEPISYLNTNVGIYGDDLPSEIQEQFTRCAKRIGYRLRTTSVSFPTAAMGGGRLPVSAQWLNEGLATPSLSFGVKWSLHDTDGKCAFESLDFPFTPTTAWKPGETIADERQIKLPATLAAGTYTLKLMLWLPEEDKPINLALQNRDAEGRYAIGQINVVDGSKITPAVLYRPTFDMVEDCWSPTISTLNVAVGQDSQPCMHITGSKQTNAWNFIHHGKVVAQTVPWGTYRLTMMVKINKLSPGSVIGRPCPKIGINNLEGKWLKNALGDAYDMSHVGEWQKLVAVAELDGGTYSLDLTLETGNFSAVWDDIDILVGDITLEMVALP